DRLDHVWHGRTWDRELDLAHELAGLRGDLRDGGVDLAERRGGTLGETLAGIGERHAPRRAGEEHHAKRPLELLDRLAHRRRRDAEIASGGREAAPPGDGQEHVDLGEHRGRKHAGLLASTMKHGLKAIQLYPP